MVINENNKPSKVVYYNNDNQPYKLVYHTPIGVDSIELELTIDNKITSVTSSGGYFLRNDTIFESGTNDFYHYNPTTKAATIKQNDKTSEIQYNESRLVNSVKEISRDAMVDASYLYTKEGLSLIQNKDTKDTEAEFTYYQNGLLRSHYSPLFTSRGLTSETCYSYSIGGSRRITMARPLKQGSGQIRRRVVICSGAL